MLFKELLYIPNILEYIRLYLLYQGLYTKNIWLFLLNYFIDFIDGPIARKLNQTSKFGCFLDHFIDRLTVSLPSIVLIYNNNFDLFLIFSVVESCANIYYNYIKKNKHMKHNHNNDNNRNILVNYYYSNNRYNILSYCSLLPYFAYSPLLYCLDTTIPLYILYLLRFGLFLYFIIFIEKFKVWNALLISKL